MGSFKFYRYTNYFTWGRKIYNPLLTDMGFRQLGNIFHRILLQEDVLYLHPPLSGWNALCGQEANRWANIESNRLSSPPGMHIVCLGAYLSYSAICEDGCTRDGRMLIGNIGRLVGSGNQAREEGVLLITSPKKADASRNLILLSSEKTWCCVGCEFWPV